MYPLVYTHSGMDVDIVKEHVDGLSVPVDVQEGIFKSNSL